MAFTDLAIKRALPGEKIVKLSDGGGLQLWITPDGAKRWRIAYRFGGSQKTLAVGVYPDIGLKDARLARDAARKTMAGGEDPWSRRPPKPRKPKRKRTPSPPSRANWRKRSGETRRRARQAEIIRKLGESEVPTDNVASVALLRRLVDRMERGEALG